MTLPNAMAGKAAPALIGAAVGAAIGALCGLPVALFYGRAFFYPATIAPGIGSADYVLRVESASDLAIGALCGAAVGGAVCAALRRDRALGFAGGAGIGAFLGALTALPRMALAAQYGNMYDAVVWIVSVAAVAASGIIGAGVGAASPRGAAAGVGRGAALGVAVGVAFTLPRGGWTLLWQAVEAPPQIGAWNMVMVHSVDVAVDAALAVAAGALAGAIAGGLGRRLIGAGADSPAFAACAALCAAAAAVAQSYAQLLPADIARLLIGAAVGTLCAAILGGAAKFAPDAMRRASNRGAKPE